jgi:hypothetical protein
MPTATKDIFRDDQPLIQGVHSGSGANLVPDANFKSQSDGVAYNWSAAASSDSDPTFGYDGENSSSSVKFEFDGSASPYFIGLYSTIPDGETYTDHNNPFLLKASQGTTFYIKARYYLSSDFSDGATGDGIKFQIIERDSSGTPTQYPEVTTGIGTLGAWADFSDTITCSDASTVGVLPHFFVYGTGGSYAGYAIVDWVYYGTEDPATALTVLRDTGIDFTLWGANTGLYCENATLNTGGLIASLSSHQISATGVTWRKGDTYKIYRTATKNSYISGVWCDVSRGFKIDERDDITSNGWRRKDVDLDEPNRRQVFGPGQPEVSS